MNQGGGWRVTTPSAPILKEILDKLEVVPERDAFANKDNKRFEKWYGEGSPEGEDAFEKKLGE